MDALVVTPVRRRPMTFALVLLAVAAATVAGAFAFQAAGYPPCDLCLEERVPYYAAIALAGAAMLSARRGPRIATLACFLGLAVVFLGSAGLGIYHAGVEWGLWAGPTECTGTLGHATSSADFLRQLRTVKVVRCDAAAVRVLGLSLAGWNVLVSLAAAGVALAGIRDLSFHHLGSTQRSRAFTR